MLIVFNVCIFCLKNGLNNNCALKYIDNLRVIQNNESNLTE